MNKINDYISKSWPAAVIFLAGYIANKVLDSGSLFRIFQFDNYNKIGALYNSKLIVLAFIGMPIVGALAGIFSMKIMFSISSKHWTKTIIYTAIVFLCLWSSLFISNVSLQTQKSEVLSNNLEIIHPFISEKDYIKYKSDILQIDSKNSFNKIDNIIRKTANDNNAKIH